METAALRCTWISSYGSTEAAVLLMRYRDTAERMLDAALRGCRSPREKLQLVRAAFEARNGEVTLLGRLGKLEEARRLRQEPRMTPEDFAAIAKILAEPDLFDNLADEF